MSMIKPIARHGFSLMELMIVVSVLGVLAALTLIGIQSLDDVLPRKALLIYPFSTPEYFGSNHQFRSPP